jgi:hypothetical protein
MILYHFTCAHAAPRILAAGELRGSPHRMLPQIGPIVWLTDLDVGARRELGLPPIQDGCDRVAYRVQVELEEPVRWASWARRNLPKAQWSAVEVNCPGSLVAQWWLSLSPVPITTITPDPREAK